MNGKLLFRQENNTLINTELASNDKQIVDYLKANVHCNGKAINDDDSRR